jgi:Family of unknown function (DUF6884)
MSTSMVGYYLIMVMGSIANGRRRSLEVRPEECLVFMPCGQKKLDHGAPVNQLYTSPLWNTWRTHALMDAPQMIVLSAKHGFIDQDTWVEPYVQKLYRAVERHWIASLEDNRVVDALCCAARSPIIRDVLLVGSEEYRRVMRIAVTKLIQRGRIDPEASIDEAAGEVGEKCRQLRLYLIGLRMLM